METFTALVIAVTALVSALAGLFISLVKAKSAIEESIPKKLKKQSTINVEIMKHMEDLKEKLGADRVQVYDFHNGGHYANGRSALKLWGS